MTTLPATTAETRRQVNARVNARMDAYLLADELWTHHLSAAWIYERYDRADDAQAARAAYERVKAEADALWAQLKTELGADAAWLACQRRRAYWKQRTEAREAAAQQEREEARRAFEAIILAKPLPARVQLVSEHTVGCYYHDADGVGWGTSSRQAQPCTICGATITDGYACGLGDVFVCSTHIEHVETFTE